MTLVATLNYQGSQGSISKLNAYMRFPDNNIYTILVHKPVFFTSLFWSLGPNPGFKTILVLEFIDLLID